MIITRRYFNALAATSAFMSSIAANRADALAWPTRPVHLVVPFAVLLVLIGLWDRYEPHLRKG